VGSSLGHVSSYSLQIAKKNQQCTFSSVQALIIISDYVNIGWGTAIKVLDNYLRL